MLFLFAAIASQVLPFDSDAGLSFRDQHVGDPAALMVALDPSTDQVIGIIGTFAVGLDYNTSRDPSLVADAVLRFVTDNGDTFGTGPQTRLQLIHQETVDIDQQTSAFHYTQAFNGHAIFGGEITVTIRNDGTLHSINGQFSDSSMYDNMVLDLPNSADVATVAHAAAQTLAADPLAPHHYGIASLNEPDSYLSSPGRMRFTSEADDISIERLLAFNNREVFWQVETPTAIVRVYDDLVDPVMTSKLRHATGSCSVRHSDYVYFAGTGQTFDFTSGECCLSNDCDSCPGGTSNCSNLQCSGGICCNEGGKSGTTLDSAISCDANEWFGDCYWQLKRESGVTHSIPRVDDANGSELEIFDSSCDSTPTFNSTNSDNLEEQTAFYGTHRARGLLLQNCWGEIPVDRSAIGGVDVHVDDDALGPIGAYFDPLQTSLHIGSLRGRDLDVLYHEYGHYGHWVYGDLSTNCSGSDFGGPLGETLANVFGYIVAYDDPNNNLTYCAVNGFGGGQGPAPHTSSASKLLSDTDPTPCDDLDVHLVGLAFEQAIWELLWNRNCNSDSCGCNLTFGSTIWSGETRDQVTMHVGRAIAHAEKVLGSSQTYMQVSLHMRDQILTDSGTLVRDRAGYVLSHHGY